ncbi:hypothetical protein KOW79_021774 [Hemibagrus wyckioides]|uniref:Uncharacterized protein n=1 Tax=Hemibagrus wyckioides TaxID=337641 RepID=A0A9D3N0V2_9TELE|nr:hypothetical protein KOW79_021774 [Hemibagrus wyckioides]
MIEEEFAWAVLLGGLDDTLNLLNEADPVQTGSLLDPGLKCGDETQTDSAVPQVTLAESEEKHKQATESVEQMQKQDADLKSQIDTLKNTVQQLGHLLTQKHTECTDTTRLYETELNLRKHVQSEYKQKKEKFNQETRSLRVALIEAEWKYEQAMESNAQLENSSLKDYCILSTSSIFNIISELLFFKDECEREKEAHSVLKVDQMTSTHHEELLQGIQAKATELYRESHDHLKSDELKNEVNKLRESVQQLERELSESCRKCEEIKRECERDQEHHSVLKCDQMTSTHLLELVQVSQAEAEEKFEYTAQLENENSDLKSQVNTLQDTVQELSRLLAETHRKCEKAKEEHKVAEDILQFVETRTRKRQRFLIQKKKSIQESLDECERKYTEEMKSKNNLDYLLPRRTNLALSLNQDARALSNDLSDMQWTLEQTMQELEQKTHQLAQIDSDWKCLNETVMKDHEAECLAHGLLKVQYSEMKQQHDKLEEREREDYNLLKARCQQMEETLQEYEELLKGLFGWRPKEQSRNSEQTLYQPHMMLYSVIVMDMIYFCFSVLVLSGGQLGLVVLSSDGMNTTPQREEKIKRHLE